MATHTFVPAPLPAGITIPDDGDDRESASVNVPLEALLDAVAQTYTGYLYIPLDNPVPTVNPRFAVSMPAGFPLWSQDDLTDAGGIPFSVPAVPVGARIVSLQLLVAGGAGHGALPATMPSVTMSRRAGDSTGSDGELVDADIAAVDVTEHQSTRWETFALAAGGYLDTEDSDYIVEVRGETGADSELGFTLAKMRLVLEQG